MAAEERKPPGVGKVVHRSRRLYVAESQLTDSDGTEIARGDTHVACPPLEGAQRHRPLTANRVRLTGYWSAIAAHPASCSLPGFCQTKDSTSIRCQPMLLLK